VDRNLAWKLTSVFRDSLLDSYTQERKPHIRELVATTKALGLIIGELDPDKARRRDETLGADLDSGAAETVRQKFIPDLTAGILATARDGRLQHPAGVLSPQPEIVDHVGRHVLLDDIVGVRFALLTTGLEAQAWPDEKAEAILARLGGVRVNIAATGTSPGPHPLAVSEVGTLFQDFMNKAGCRALVVRPDKYVFGGASDAETLNRHVHQIANALSIF
jgi:3-(3-hydroxy-phenyl)propionate hydroxylase